LENKKVVDRSNLANVETEMNRGDLGGNLISDKNLGERQGKPGVGSGNSTVSTGELSCLCFNAQSIVAKVDCLQATVEVYRPDVIGVTESWANEDIGDAELGIEGYDLFRHDRPTGNKGGGVLLYVKHSLSAVEFTPLAKFPEQVWCSLKTKSGTELFIGVCYRSPSGWLFNEDTHSLLRDVMVELHNKTIILMGDFNYPDVDWSTLQAATTESRLFVETLEDCFLTQQVKGPTRNGTLLDLVITSEPHMVDEVKVLGHFGSGDHNMLQWSTNVSVDHRDQKVVRLDYAKADYVKIRQELEGVDWSEEMKGNAQECWDLLKNRLQKLETQYVPIKRTGVGKWRKPMWMTYRAAKSVAKKHKLYAKYKDPDHRHTSRQPRRQGAK
jgi:hypothetical protein